MAEAASGVGYYCPACRKPILWVDAEYVDTPAEKQALAKLADPIETEQTFAQFELTAARRGHCVCGDPAEQSA